MPHMRRSPPDSVLGDLDAALLQFRQQREDLLEAARHIRGGGHAR